MKHDNERKQEGKAIHNGTEEFWLYGYIFEFYGVSG
jgi:hypothetical protein